VQLRICGDQGQAGQMIIERLAKPAQAVDVVLKKFGQCVR